MLVQKRKATIIVILMLGWAAVIIMMIKYDHGTNSNDYDLGYNYVDDNVQFSNE